MILNIFGQKLRPEILILIMLVGALIGINLLCGCAGGVKEGFDAGVNLAGAALDYTLGKDIPYGWKDTAIQQDAYKPGDVYKHLENNVGGTFPNPDNKLTMLDDTEFAPRCCPSAYTSSTGCACLSPEQAKYLTQRGGNRTQEITY